MFGTLFSAQSMPLAERALSLLAFEQNPFLWVAKDGHVISLTESAHALTGLASMESVFEVLSERAASVFRLCMMEQASQEITETVDERSFVLCISPVDPDSALVYYRDVPPKDGITQFMTLTIRKALALARLYTDGARDEQEERPKDLMKREVLRLQRLVEHVETVTAQGTGERIVLEKTDLSALCSRVSCELASHMKRPVWLDLRGLSQACPWICDVGQIETALYNLLTNSVNAGATRITLSLTLREDAVTLRVADNGRGMPEGAAFRLYHEWEQPWCGAELLERTANNSAPGIGVPLTARIAGLHGGVLWYEKNEPQGVRANLTLGRLPEPADSCCAHPFSPDTGVSRAELELCALE